MSKKETSQKFEQAFLEKAFTVSIESDVGKLDVMVRSLKSLLVQNKVKTQLSQSETDAQKFLVEIQNIEEKPIKDINANIYTICGWIRRDINTITVWDKGIPIKSLSTLRMRENLIPVLDRLTVITGSLCDILDVQILNFGKRSASWKTSTDSHEGISQ